MLLGIIIYIFVAGSIYVSLCMDYFSLTQEKDFTYKEMLESHEPKSVNYFISWLWPIFIVIALYVLIINYIFRKKNEKTK